MNDLFTLFVSKIIMYVKKGWELAALTLSPQMSSLESHQPCHLQTFPRD